MSKIKFTTTVGVFVAQVDIEKAPNTVENFLKYVEEGYYDGLIFHRVIKDFMVQGGGLRPGLFVKETRDSIINEANNGLKNEKYSIAMARTYAAHSATSQFYINTNENTFLDYPGNDGWGYCVFGKVIEGTEVIDTMNLMQTESAGMHRDVPVIDIVITKAEVIE